MRTQQTASTTVADIATHVACSPDHLCRIFKKTTGKGILQNLHDIRMEKAKNLLRQSSLNVSEIAFETGFENHSAFARLFRKTTGTTPTLFRKSMQTEGGDPSSPLITLPPKATQVVVRDNFTSDNLSKWWKTEGTWKMAPGFVEGHATPWASLILESPLPENFRVEFEVQTEQESFLKSPPVVIRLLADDRESIHTEVILPASAGNQAELQIRRRTLLRSTGAVLESGSWHTIRLEYNNNHLTTFLNGKRIFTYRDLFPSLYASRCRFGLYTFRRVIKIRRFHLSDLGFMPVVSEIRLGDTLFNSGLFAQAHDFYMRHLRTGLTAEEETELRFKIGMCLFQQGQFPQCRDWIQNILPVAHTPYWRRECNMLLLQIDAETGQTGAFERHAKASLKDPPARDGIIRIAENFSEQLEKSGFLDQALRIGQLVVSIEQRTPSIELNAWEVVAKILKKLKQFQKAESLLRPLCRGHHLDVVKNMALVSLFDICLLRRQFLHAYEIIGQLRALHGAHPIGIWSDILEAACLRAEQRFEEAADLLRAACAKPSSIERWHFAAPDPLVKLLYCLGQSKEASRLIKVIRNDPSADINYEFLRGSIILSYLDKKKYEELATLLLANSRRENRPIFTRGQDAITAGIMMALADKPEESQKVWLETSRRFPVERCYFWGTLAKALATGKPDHLESMHHYFNVRSEIFYLTGLFYENRGNTTRARRLFTLSLEEDPTLLWPAHLALIKLKQDHGKG